MAKNKAAQRARSAREREKMLRQQQARARKIRTALTVVVVLVVGVSLFFLFKGDGKSKTTSALNKPTPTPSTFWSPTPAQCGPKECYTKFPTGETLLPGVTYTADIVTNHGTITVALDAAGAPRTVASFLFLAGHHFFDGLTFHRVIPKFMIQGGDPKGNGTGGPGYQYSDENQVPGFGQAGVLAMANSGPNTNGSQFFITVAPTTFLNGKYNIFGHVLKGQNIADLVSKVKTDGPKTNKPIQPVVIKSITIHTSGSKPPTPAKKKK